MADTLTVRLEPAIDRRPMYHKSWPCWMTAPCEQVAARRPEIERSLRRKPGFSLRALMPDLEK